MLPFLLRSTTPLLAMDVSSESLQLLEFSGRKQRLQLRNYLSYRLPVNCVHQQRVTDISLFSETLTLALKRFKPKLKHAIMALPVNQVICKNLTLLSHLSPAEVTKHIHQEVLAQMPTSASEVYWDYAYLPPKAAEEGTKEIAIVIAQQASINPYVHALGACGLSLRAVDIESFALARAFTFCYPKLAINTELQALFLLRQQLITLILVQGSNVVHARLCPLEPADTYETSALAGVQQLWRTLPLNPEWPALKRVWLMGEGAPAAYSRILSADLQVPVSLLELESVSLGENLVCASNIFLGLGLSLWSEKR